ncbi:MAG: hypothetical protein R3188_02475 [Acidiferrobacterales bacterium]|nr:hypothetical protein [Acidiferrobacterales bacterium]
MTTESIYKSGGGLHYLWHVMARLSGILLDYVRVRFKYRVARCVPFTNQRQDSLNIALNWES